MHKTKRVLFLGTANAGRSQMTEALLRYYAGDRFEVHSAGLEPVEIHPFTLQVLAEARAKSHHYRGGGALPQRLR